MTKLEGEGKLLRIFVGESDRLHTTGLLRLSEDLPVVIEIVDTEEQIDRVLPFLDEMVGEGMVTLERVQIIAYRGSRIRTQSRRVVPISGPGTPPAWARPAQPCCPRARSSS